MLPVAILLAAVAIIAYVFRSEMFFWAERLINGAAGEIRIGCTNDSAFSRAKVDESYSTGSLRCEWIYCLAY